MYNHHLDLKLPDVGKHYVRKQDNTIVKVVDMFREDIGMYIVEYYDSETDFNYFISAHQFVDQYQPVTGMW